MLTALSCRASLLAGVAIAMTGLPQAHAFTITPCYSPSPGWTPELQQTITQACSDWTSRLAFEDGNAQEITVNFAFEHAGSAIGTYLAFWSFSRSGPLPRPYSPGMTHLITVNEDFLPLTYTGLATPAASDGYDFLSVIRHELGHALGFAYFTYLGDSFSDPWSKRIVNGIFDPWGMAVPMNSDKSHVAISDDLMYATLPPGIRKDISQRDLDMLALAYNYSAEPVHVPEPASLALLSVAGALLLRRPQRR